MPYHTLIWGSIMRDQVIWRQLEVSFGEPFGSILTVA